MKAKKTRVRPDPPGPPALLRGSGTKNYVAKFTNPTTLANSQIFDNGTNVGVGTVNPMDKFDVRGNIKLGSNAEFFGLGGIENLLLVRGMVNTDGTSFAQPGFSVAKAGTGQYVVTLTTPPPFNGSCFAVVTPFSDDGSLASAVITRFTGGTIGFSFSASTFNSAGTLSDRRFFFIAAVSR
jgi:hypothetical protein